jgi:hypothetical protein
MCDVYAGSLLASFHRDDPAADRVLRWLDGGPEPSAFGDELPTAELPRGRVTPLLTLLDELHAEEGRNLLDHFPHAYYRIQVPVGSERAVAAEARRLHIETTLGPGTFEYLLDPELAPLIETEGILQTGALGTATASQGFNFSAEHHSNLTLIDARPVVAQPVPVTVGVLDSGWSATSVPVTVASELDLTGGAMKGSAPDTYGHGSVVASIIGDVAPDAALNVYRVATGSEARESVFLAGLVQAAAQCQVINASIGFGLLDRDCVVCGREYGTNRSLIFERLLGSLLAIDTNLVFVAAAGNQASNRVVYPGRYPHAVCVGATDDVGTPSTFSNHGAVDHEGNPHPTVVFAPGGDRQHNGTGSDQYVADYLGRSWRGTSFATAYVTGIVAAHLVANPGEDRDTVLDGLRRAADPAKVTGYTASDHGAGLAQFL